MVLLAVLVFPARAGEAPAFPVGNLGRAHELIMDGVRNPADILEFEGRLVVTELLTNRLAILDYPDFKGFEYFHPESIGESFQSPHYMAKAPDGGLLISNGWGSSIVRIDDLKGAGWTRFSGKGRKFNAPHGICVDADGWIYVGDSLNSRVVRFRDMEGAGWQVFRDVDRKISYVRKLHCDESGVWISNSYEARPGLNPGRGSSILRIVDFDSGRVEELFAIENSNITGILPIKGNTLLVGLWGKEAAIGLLELGEKTFSVAPRVRDGLGIPYGFLRQQGTGFLFVTHTGALQPGDRRTGALAVHVLQ